MIVLHALLLLAAFSLRYNALYFVLVAAMAFILCNKPIVYKLAGISSYCLLIGAFVVHTRNEVSEITGTPQFSPFGAWTLASNALYMYSNIYPDPRIPKDIPEKFRKLDNLTRDSFFRWKYHFDLLQHDITAGSCFMFKENSPLVEYMGSAYAKKLIYLNTDKWFKVAPLYQSYGVYLIKTYPKAFVAYFLWPNFIRYGLPPVDMMGAPQSFMLYEHFDPHWITDMYGLTDITPDYRSIVASGVIMSIYPFVFGFLHLLFVLGFIGFIASGNFKRLGKECRAFFLLIGMLWGTDFVFSILTSAIVLRYQIFMSIFECTYGFYFLAEFFSSVYRGKADVLSARSV
jgi:hypothetical protein